MTNYIGLPPKKQGGFFKYGMSYQTAVDYQRRRHAFGGYPWPGKPVGADAVTRYPNILAELAASGYWLKTLAEFANVSPEIMAAVIEDGEELSGLEFYSLARRWNGCGLGYLSAPVLQVVDPATNKGKVRRRKLDDYLNAVDGMKVSKWELSQFEMADNVYQDLISDRPVTFARWWWACRRLQEIIIRNRPRPVRTERRAAV